jgi:hypothetical protein
MMPLLILQHFKTPCKGKLPHHVKCKPVKPCRHVYRLIVLYKYRYAGFQLLGVLGDTVFVDFQRFGREAVVPDSAALVMKGLVACGVDGDFGEEEVIPDRFAAGVARTINGREDGGIEDGDFIGAWWRVSLSAVV